MQRQWNNTWIMSNQVSFLAFHQLVNMARPVLMIHIYLMRVGMAKSPPQWKHKLPRGRDLQLMKMRVMVLRHPLHLPHQMVHTKLQALPLDILCKENTMIRNKLETRLLTSKLFRRPQQPLPLQGLYLEQCQWQAWERIPKQQHNQLLNHSNNQMRKKIWKPRPQDRAKIYVHLSNR